MRIGLLPQASDLADQHSVVLCGDILPAGKLVGDSFPGAAGLTLIRCSENREQVLSRCEQLNASLVVARQAFLDQLSSSDLAQLTNYGKGSQILAILEDDAVETTAASKMIRIGCSGALPSRFTLTLFGRAVSAILKGEFWAPRVVLSELLTEQLRAASLRADLGLTPQEARILELARKGYTSSAIADALFISQETVRWHKRRLNRKLRGSGQDTQAKSIFPARKVAGS